MKNLIKIFLSLIIVGLTFSCEKELSTEGVSRTTYFPVLTLNGNVAMSVPLNGTFTDPGYECKSGTETVNVTVTGTVDVSTPGVYTLTYTSDDTPDGFNSVAYRYVGVIDPSAAGNSFEGNYYRTSNNCPIVWKKLDPGCYEVDNVGGAPTFAVVAYVFNITGTTITVPPQESSAGSLDCINETYTIGPPTQYSWAVVNSSFGTATRTFRKL